MRFLQMAASFKFQFYFAHTHETRPTIRKPRRVRPPRLLSGLISGCEQPNFFACVSDTVQSPTRTNITLIVTFIFEKSGSLISGIYHLLLSPAFIQLINYALSCSASGPIDASTDASTGRRLHRLVYHTLNVRSMFGQVSKLFSV